MITENTRHLFPAGHIAAWNEAVHRHAGDLDNDDNLNDEASNKEYPDVP